MFGSRLSLIKRLVKKRSSTLDRWLPLRWGDQRYLKRASLYSFRGVGGEQLLVAVPSGLVHSWLCHHVDIFLGVCLKSKSKYRALVTGASRGIGRQIALDLANSGVYVIGVSRASENLFSLQSGLSNSAGGGKTIAMDLDRSDSARKLIEQVTEHIDIMVHNVGGNLELTDPLGGSEDFFRVISHNMSLSIDLNSHFIPKMQANRWGRVCHVSSISALENQGPPSYSAAKASINSYVRGLGRFVAKDGVVITSLMPGAVLTEGGYWDEATRTRPGHVDKFIAERMAIGRFGTVQEISKVAQFLVSDASSFMTGSCVLVDGGQGRVIQMVEQV